MILTTTNNIPGDRYVVEDVLGIVGAEVVSGVNFLKDFTAGIRNIIGGRSGAYENELVDAQKEALEELEARAKQMGADAVLGISFDYTTFGADSGIIALVVNGTAVTLRK